MKSGRVGLLLQWLHGTSSLGEASQSPAARRTPPHASDASRSAFTYAFRSGGPAATFTASSVKSMELWSRPCRSNSSRIVGVGSLTMPDVSAVRPRADEDK